MPQQYPSPPWIHPMDLDFWVQIEMFYKLPNNTCLGNTSTHDGGRTEMCGRALDPTNPYQYHYASTGLRIDGTISNSVCYTESIFSNVSFHGHRLLCPTHQDQTLQLLSFWYEHIRYRWIAQQPCYHPQGVGYAARYSPSSAIPQTFTSQGWHPAPRPSIPQDTHVQSETTIPTITPHQEEPYPPRPRKWGPDARQSQRECTVEPHSALSTHRTQGRSPHVPRRELLERCPLCFVRIRKGDSAALNELVWCKGGCGNSLHANCFELWKETLLKDLDWNFGEGSPGEVWKKITCVICRAAWERPCCCDTHTLPEGYIEAGENHIPDASVST